MSFARSRGSRIRALLLVTVALGLVLAYVMPAAASHPEVSLPGSNFEIDTDANLRVDDAAPSLDWANVTEARKADTPSGTSDESFGQGTKEDTAVPSVVDGGIPPNKSDLKFFGVHQEGGSSSGFLNLFWSRVQDPTGTTNMDFEFNQSTTASANGVTPVRTAGDLLIIYDLAQGGTRPVLSLRTWTGSAWGPATNLTASNKATGSINTSPIPVGESDGLGAQSARTFGEAQLALSAIFDPNVCKSFGSAYLKSRSSDSFTAALKDFVPPVAVDISNCGSVKIIKKDDAGSALAGAEFTLYNDDAPVGGNRGSEDTATAFKCTTDADGTCTISNIPQGEYWVVETKTPANHDTAADQHATVTPDATVTLTFVNPRQPGSVKITKLNDATPPSPLAGAEFTLYKDNEPIGGTRGAEDTITTHKCTTGADGTCEIPNVVPGEYWVVETVTPPNHDTAADQHVTVKANEQVTVTFVDPRHRGAIEVTKLRKHAADGPGDHPHAGVDFTVNGVTKTTDANGQVCFDGLLFGDYTVHEVTPAGYKGEADKTVTVDNKASCAGNPFVGEKVAFHNMPLSNITVSFESQVPGGTASQISCTGLTADPADGTPDTFDDTSETFKDLEPGTYTCTVVVDP
jgi:hypothetical protein